MESLKKNGKYSPVKLILAITGLITILSGAALAWYKTLTGEPEAKEVREDSAKAYGDVHKTLAQMKTTIENLQKTQTKQGEVVEKQTRRIFFFQGVNEGVTAGKLLADNETLKKKFDMLISRRGGKSAVQLLKDELELERKMRKMAESRAARAKVAKSKPAASGAVQITLPPAAPFRKKGSK